MSERLIKQGDVPRLLAMLGAQQAVFLAAGFGLWVWSGRNAGDFIRFGRFDIGAGLAIAAVMIGLQALLTKLAPKLTEQLVREMSRLLFSTERPYGAGAVLIISFSAGIGEEALFRGGLQTLVGDYLPGWAAIVAATALFTLLHPGSRMFMFLIAIVSLLFGVFYALSGSLLAVMIAHALFDVDACVRSQRELRRIGHWDAPPPVPN